MEYTKKRNHKKRLRKADERLKRSLTIINNASFHLNADTLSTDNNNLNNTSIEQNSPLSINTSNTLLYNSLSLNNLTNFFRHNHATD